MSNPDHSAGALIRANSRMGEWLLLAAASVAALFLRTTPGFAPVGQVLSRHGSDDMFYFVQTAVHFAGGNGLSFDGEHATSGVQPLLVLLLAPFAVIFEGRPELALRIVFLLAGCLVVATGWMMPGLAERVLGGPKGRHLGLIAAMFWMVHPRILGLSLLGSEAPLAALCWVLSIRTWLCHEESAAGQFRFGFVLGIGALARIDHLVLAACLCFFRPGGQLLLSPRRWFPLTGGLVSVILPWLLFCLVTTGSVVQDSGAAKRLHAVRFAAISASIPPGSGAKDEHSVGRVTLSHIQQGATAAVSALWSTGSALSYLSLLTLIFVALVLMVLSWLKTRRLISLWIATRALIYELWPVFLAVLLICLAYLFILHGLRTWYLTPAFLLLTLLAASILYDLAEATGIRKRPVIFAIGLLFWFVASHLETERSPRRAWGHHYVEMAERVAVQVPPGARIGAFNAGIFGAWLHPHGRVINLDGVANHSALLALKQRTLTQYIIDQRIEYLMDHGSSLDFYEKVGGAGLTDRIELVDRFEIAGQSEAWFGLWRVKPTP